ADRQRFPHLVARIVPDDFDLGASLFARRQAVLSEIGHAFDVILTAAGLNARDGVDQRLHAGGRSIAAGADRRVALGVGVAETGGLVVLPFAVTRLVDDDFRLFALDANRFDDARRIADALEDQV